MEKFIFKYKYLNIIIGVLLIALSIVGYILGWMEDFFPIVIGVILILISLKRFIYSYKKIVSKNAALILTIELILDIVFAGLLISLQDHVELFIGLTIYSRGVSYLLINYIATRKTKLFQYILNIVYVTFGAFLMFYPLNSLKTLVIIVSIMLLLTGLFYLYFGIKPFDEKRKAKKQAKLTEKDQEKLDKKQVKEEEKLDKLETKASKIDAETQKALEESKTIQKEIAKAKETIKTQQVNLEEKTLVELKAMAKDYKLENYSQLNKPELIIKLKEYMLKTNKS